MICSSVYLSTINSFSKELIFIDAKYFRPAEVETLLGDASKAKEQLGWEPKITFDELVKDMCVNEV